MASLKQYYHDGIIMTSLKQYFHNGIIMALRKCVHLSMRTGFSGEQCIPWASYLFLGVTWHYLFFPVGIRVRIGSQYPWLVVRGD